MSGSLAVHTAAQGGSLGELTPVGFGILTISTLLALLIVTYAFRSIGTRYRNRDH